MLNKLIFISALFSISVLADRHDDIIMGLVEPNESDFELMYEIFV